LGCLLELVGAKEQARALKEYVHRHARDWTALVPGASRARARRVADWLLYVNSALTIGESSSPSGTSSTTRKSATPREP